MRFYFLVLKMKYEGLNKTADVAENAHLKDDPNDDVRQDSLDASSGTVKQPVSFRTFYEKTKAYGLIAFAIIFVLMLIGMPEFRSALPIVIYWGLVVIAYEFWPLFLLLLAGLITLIVYAFLRCAFHF